MVEDRKGKLRSALVEAAESVVAEHGLAALRARDLARTVGRALGGLYTVFPDLDALVLEVNRRTLALFEAHVGVLPQDRAGGRQSALDALVALALAYLDFAAAHRRRWRALFEHRMADGGAPPDWYVAEQARLFRHVEAPLAQLRPDLPESERALLARTLFSAVHGMVSLGLDEKLVSLPAPVLRAQVETVVAALGRGLIQGRERA
jgi:AcrR family transcriptional regulator